MHRPAHLTPADRLPRAWLHSASALISAAVTHLGSLCMPPPAPGTDSSVPRAGYSAVRDRRMRRRGAHPLKTPPRERASQPGSGIAIRPDQRSSASDHNVLEAALNRRVYGTSDIAEITQRRRNGFSTGCRGNCAPATRAAPGPGAASLARWTGSLWTNVT